MSENTGCNTIAILAIPEDSFSCSCIVEVYSSATVCFSFVLFCRETVCWSFFMGEENNLRNSVIHFGEAELPRDGTSTPPGVVLRKVLLEGRPLIAQDIYVPSPTVKHLTAHESRGATSTGFTPTPMRRI
ncbi:hypothetical protein TNCV_4352681 [Trichonephila clavipes]|nr:hypothetical protein TNCV_4352681 [Trichonephila clavipes]